MKGHLMDLSLEAIENDLRNAEQQAGRPAMQLHLTQANIRATLLAASAGKSTPTPAPAEPVDPASPFVSDSNDVAIQRHPLGSVYVVPVAASNADRRQVVADILGVPKEVLDDLLAPRVPLRSVVPESTEALIVAAEDDDSDVDDDFFADVRKGRRK